MALIEKAVQAAGLMENADFLATNAKKARRGAQGDKAQGIPFELDFTGLADQGFYTPDQCDGPLAMELRAIKRRLLRRVGYLNRKRSDHAMAQRGRRRNLVMVTSTRAGEGKTFTACNLALSLACDDDIDVLMIDGDAPRPKLRAHFGLPEGPGLVDALLNDRLDADALAFRAGQAPLSILGEGGPVSAANEAFADAQAQRFFSSLSASADDGFVIVDAPPVLATTEAVHLARFVDEIVFVVEADETPQPAVATALDELLEVNPNISLVLNRCLFTGGGSHYGSYKKYGESASQRSTGLMQSAPAERQEDAKDAAPQQ